MTLDILCPKHDRQSRTGQGITPHGAAEACKACNKLTALEKLRALCPPGTTVYTILRSVSRSGMSRVITPVILDPVDGKPLNLTHHVKHVLSYRVRQGFQDGLIVNGCGMDMGYDVVNNLSYALHGHNPDTDPFKIETLRTGRKDFRPGYTLNHRWL